MYSLKDAAEAVGLGKPAILKAIQKGRISAKKNDFGQWEIDPSELHRVYKPVPNGIRQGNGIERQGTQETAPETIVLKAKLEAMDGIKARLENECNDLRRRLDLSDEARQKAEEAKDIAFKELSRLTLMLAPPPQQTETPPRKGFFRRFFRG